MPAGVYGAGLRRADTVRDGLAMIAAEGKNKVRKRLVSGLYFYNTEEAQTRNFASPSTSGSAADTQKLAPCSARRKSA